ncbi:glycosyltransferase [Parapedobacter sp. 10938]|uniref:glycosyltransferase n=1 Tax=Parapedobacter flavus TaxID=3110225 RepID=UPI002DBBC643|nr:glycosyltransferase [Parapedobacter sp. 10938]MEC3879889.1 glycosyltransferase [Parapedobacter sp. 10938]
MHLDKVSLLITHYNRSQSLNRLLQSFVQLDMFFAEIVVSDDCSDETHISAIQQLSTHFKFKLVKSPQNMGLGNNINKGQAEISTPYTLYVQEDFIPSDRFKERLYQSLVMMEANQTIDLMRFYAYVPYPYLKPKNEFGFSEMYLPFLGYRYKKIYQYSDHPHLRRFNFVEKFGKYQEGISGDKTEYKMCLSFLQNKGKGYFYNDFKELFTQSNSEAEPSTMTRVNWRNGANPVIKMVRNVYRQLKYNFEIYFG